MRRFGAIVFAVLASWCLNVSAHASKRVALVIGNSVYQNVPRLANPAHDAAAIAAMLRKAGFDSIDFRSDLKAVEMRRALRDFGNKTRDADVAVVYYAGHGIELENANYLIPVDTVLETDTDIYDETTPLDRVLVAVEPAKQLRLIILDACRDNPFSKTTKRTVASRAIGRGLAKVEPTSPNTIIAFAAKAGFTASDGEGKNSPFALALVKHLSTPGLDLRKAFGFVRDDVLKATGGRQEPYIYGSLGGDDVSLMPKPATPPPANPQADMRRDYELALQIGTKAVWRSFLNTYPSGFYADLAKGQLDRISAEEMRVAAVENARPAQEEKMRLAAEEARLARAAAAEQARIATEKAAAEKAVVAKAEADAAAERKREAARQAEQAKVAAAEQARVAAEKAGAEKIAAAEQVRVAAEKVATEKAAAPKAEAGAAAQEVKSLQSPDASEKNTQERKQIASLAPPTDALPASKDTGALVRDIKKELRRIGCYSGAIDDQWATARTSVGKFARFSKLPAAPELPDSEFLNALRDRSDRVCPLECSARQIESNGRCVAKTCPAGSVLDEDGSCEKRSVRTVTPAPDKGGAGREKPTRSGDATRESLSIMPPGSIRTGEMMSLTARDGRKMTCTGGRLGGPNPTKRTCFWN